VIGFVFGPQTCIAYHCSVLKSVFHLGVNKTSIILDVRVQVKYVAHINESWATGQIE
jgi:hypothetical protein